MLRPDPHIYRKIIGHEVVTSGISNTVDKGKAKGKTLVDVSKPVGSFNVLPAGKIGTSASFAEIIIDRDDSREFELSVVFHLNGAYRDGQNVLANTDLLFDDKEHEHFYYPYKFDSTKEDLNNNAHLNDLKPGQIGAGTIVLLSYKIPKRKTMRSLIYSYVSSAIQAQSAFCSVPKADYESTPAQTWDLSEFNGKCVKLKGKAETEGH